MGRGVRIVKPALSASVKVEAVATSVYPIPGWSMLRSEKVAIPPTAVPVVVPRSVPGKRRPALCPIAIVTGPLKRSEERRVGKGVDHEGRRARKNRKRMYK